MTRQSSRNDRAGARLPDTAELEREGGRILALLDRPGAVLAVARDMDKAVVVRDGPTGRPERLAVIGRTLAEALALKEWIGCSDPEARIVRYSLTSAGRTALRQLAAAEGFGEAQAQFRMRDEDDDGPTVRHLRSTMADSPLTGLARRRDRDGKAFLARDLVAAGERLREDFELSQLGPKVTQNWDRFLTGEVDGSAVPAATPGEGAAAKARERVALALIDLGPGLADVALRCCCYLEGMETLEKRMGWSARSGKIVLRIALQRLKRHYDEQGKFGPTIG